MSKNIKTLVYIGIFVACMALVLGILLLSEADFSKDPVDDTETAINLVEGERDSLLSILVENKSGNFTVSKGPKSFTVNELKDLAQNTTVLNAVGNCISTVTAVDTVEENATDLAKYGLAENEYEAKVTVTKIDGTNYTVYFGKNTPDGENVYVRMGDSNDVYTTKSTTASYFFYDKTEFVSLIIMEELTQANTAPTIDYMTVTRKDWDYDVKFEDDTKNYSADEISMASSQVMISPVYAYLDITHSNDVIYGLWGLQAEAATVPFPTEEDFAEYGLDDPYCTVKLDAELNTYELILGDAAGYYYDEDGNVSDEVSHYYGYFNGIDCIFVFSVDELPWATFMPIDILSSLMTSNYILNLDYIDIKLDNKEKVDYYFDLNDDEDETEVDGTLNRLNAINGEDFKVLYQFMLKCPIDTLCLVDPAEDAKLLCTIDYRRIDGGGDILEFYDDGNNRVTIKLNGTTSFSQPKSYLNVLEQNLAIFANGGTADDLQEVW